MATERKHKTQPKHVSAKAATTALGQMMHRKVGQTKASQEKSNRKNKKF